MTDQMQRYAAELADEVVPAIAPWVRAHVVRIAEAWRPGLAAELDAATEAAASRAEAEIGSALRSLLELDVDEQPTGPLDVLRRLVPYPTEVLAAAGVPEVERDDHAVAVFPDDRYDLVPAAFADFGPEVHEAGLRWGAAKAHTVLARRRAEGRR